jgi:hypothetical protein
MKQVVEERELRKIRIIAGLVRIVRPMKALLPASVMIVLKVVILLAVAPMVGVAHAAGVRDIIYLNKYGEDVPNVSWCNDQVLTFVTHASPRPSTFPIEYSRVTTVNMLSIQTLQVRPVVVSEYAAFGAECVKTGEYLFLNGGLYSAIKRDARLPAQVLFSQFIDVRPNAGTPKAGARPNTPVLHVRRDDISFGPLRTASDGSV